MVYYNGDGWIQNQYKNNDHLFTQRPTALSLSHIFFYFLKTVEYTDIDILTYHSYIITSCYCYIYITGIIRQWILWPLFVGLVAIVVYHSFIHS